MSVMKYVASVPVVIAVVASLYGSLSYVNKLQNVIESNEKQIMVLQERIQGEFNTVNLRTGNIEQNITRAREELLIEMTQFSTQIGKLEGIVYALRDGSYKLASEAELRAVEEMVRNVNDSMNQYKYDIKELTRQLAGGY
tara:strand:+ start:366 stop:785 length:420 start_codon:yes stop_codon:yes gene_type:complete